MGQIPQDHAEWAVVDRLRQMLVKPEGPYLASQSYALFSTILCWVTQHMRVHQNYQFTPGDRAASALHAALRTEAVTDDPWCIWTEPAARIGAGGVQVPRPEGFEHHDAARFLINLRDAMAHGDARNVKPHNHGEVLVGFSFECSEIRNRQVAWQGRIVLLRSDMQRIGGALAARYCDAIKGADQTGQLEAQAGAMIEDAA